MDLLNEFKKPAGAGHQLSHEKDVVFLGSCFSENIAQKMSESGFRNLSNPFGTIFHPFPLANFITGSLKEKNEERIIRRDDVYLSLDASGSVYGMSEEELLGNIALLRSEFRNRLRFASTLIVTFGSAHAYTYLADNKTAANCHKIPGTEFQKQITPLSEMVETWKMALDLVKKHNPEIQVIFTVSPVRYKKDGWIENNRSKARLLELCAELEYRSDYFPAYEIVNDVLRDYRYFEKDGVHPNGLAIDEVWQVFASRYFSENTSKLVKDMCRLRQMGKHRILYPESAVTKSFKEKFEKEKLDFLTANPQINW